MRADKLPAWFWLASITALGAYWPLIWIFVEWSRCVAGICSASGTPPEWDFTIFWEAGRLAIAKDFFDIFVFAKFEPLIQAQLHYDIGLSPFAYPPLSLLIFVPLAYLPLGYAYAVWVVGGIVALIAALRVAGLNWLYCAMALASPPSLYNFLLGQNGAFTSAVLIAALVLAVRRPGLSGGMGALLSVKPQIGLMLPAVWISGLRWKAACIAVAIACGIFVLSVAAFGWTPWRLYLVAAVPTMTGIMNVPFPQHSQPNSISTYMFLRSFGVTVKAADIIQLAASAAALAFTFLVWRRRQGTIEAISIAVFLCLLIMPYGHNYDMIAYSAVLALLSQERGPSLPFAFFWIWPAVSREIIIHFGVVLTPVVIFCAIVWVCRMKHFGGHEEGSDCARDAFGPISTNKISDIVV